MPIKGLSQEQFQQLVIHCAELPFIQTDHWEADYIVDVMQTVLDFQMQVGTVETSLNYFRSAVQKQHQIYTHEQLVALLSRYPDTKEGNLAASQLLWNNKHWVRLELLRRFLPFLAKNRITDQPSLRAWAKQAEFERDFKGQVKGLGIAVFHWLLIRSGADSIKPDVWVINFVKRVIGKRLSEKVLVQTFKAIAPLLGETLETIDVTIWYFEKMAMATKDSPALRIVLWHQLKHQLDERLNGGEAAAKWALVLDDKARLRYEQAGLTLRPDSSVFGYVYPGKTTVQVQQSLWSRRFLLELIVWHQFATGQTECEGLTQRLEMHFNVTASPGELVARLNLEDSLLMPPALTVGELEAWATDLVDRIAEAIACCKQ